MVSENATKSSNCCFKIPNEVFLLWSDLKSLESQLLIPGDTYLNLVIRGLGDDSIAKNLNLELNSQANSLETRK